MSHKKFTKTVAFASLTSRDAFLTRSLIERYKFLESF